ncbi:hypothetical protein F4779DRAFT_594162 [Xylariaceae sp. FL0662B]|nr:hypothetical protein F4779DRAFT_594162 [Xylariaceae sp. FL0662B]
MAAVSCSSPPMQPGQARITWRSTPPGTPEDLDLLVKTGPVTDKAGRGFQRYANSKLAATTYIHALNRRLKKVSQASVYINTKLRH